MTRLKRIARVLSGIGLVLLGVAGLILPILPGWVFIIPGLILLAEEFTWARRLVDWAKAKAEKYGGEAYKRYAGNRDRSDAGRDSAGDH